jgi:hypothetical protein
MEIIIKKKKSSSKKNINKLNIYLEAQKKSNDTKPGNKTVKTDCPKSQAD